MRSETVVITGGGSGIGRAVALACARLGGKIAVLDVDGDAATAVATEARAAGSPDALAIDCDVSSEASVRDAYDDITRVLTVATRIFANAGIETNQPLHEFDPEAWRRVVEVNLIGVFLTCREAVRRLVDAELSGSLVCTSSPSAFVGFAGGGNSAYAASKGGISAFVRSAALDYASYGIRVNAVVPGATDTPMLVASLPEQDRRAEQDKIRRSAGDQIPLGRLGRPEEIASAVVWLLSDDASYVTGTNLVCDGGLMAKSANDF